MQQDEKKCKSMKELFIFLNFTRPEVFVWDSPQEKNQVLKIHEKPKFEVAEKSV